MSRANSLMPDDIDAASYSLGGVERVLAMKPGTIHGWIKSGSFHPSTTDRLSNGKGKPSSLSFRSVMQAATMQTLTVVGFSPTAAGRAAREFTEAVAPGRDPCRLFAKGGTVLVANAVPADVKYCENDFGMFGYNVVNASGNGLVPATSKATVTLDMNALVTEVAVLFRHAG